MRRIISLTQQELPRVGMIYLITKSPEDWGQTAALNTVEI